MKTSTHCCMCPKVDTLGSLAADALAAALRQGDGRSAEQFTDVLRVLTNECLAKTPA